MQDMTDEARASGEKSYSVNLTLALRIKGVWGLGL